MDRQINSKLVEVIGNPFATTKSPTPSNVHLFCSYTFWLTGCSSWPHAADVWLCTSCKGIPSTDSACVSKGIWSDQPKWSSLGAWCSKKQYMKKDYSDWCSCVTSPPPSFSQSKESAIPRRLWLVSSSKLRGRPCYLVPPQWDWWIMTGISNKNPNIIGGLGGTIHSLIIWDINPINISMNPWTGTLASCKKSN